MAKLKDKYFDQGSYYCFSGHHLLIGTEEIITIEGFEDITEFDGLYLCIAGIGTHKTSIVLKKKKIYRQHCVQITQEQFNKGTNKVTIIQ